MELGYSILLKGIKLRQFLADLSNTIFLFFLEYLKCLVKKKSENIEKVFLMKVCWKSYEINIKYCVDFVTLIDMTVLVKIT